MNLRIFSRQILVLAALLSIASAMLAQPAASPLTIQGLDQSTVAGVRSRAMGGTGIAGLTDATALFSNPAGLGQLTSPEIHVGGIFGALARKQTQEWVPMRPVPGLSLLFEGLTGTIKKPDSLGIPGLPLSAWSSLQRQYDALMPNWDRNSTETQPLSLVAAMPLTVGTMHITAGVGFSQVIDLNQYYQNNNSMTPYLGQERPDPMLITQRNDTLHVRWYQYVREREGAVFAVTPAVAVTVLPGLNVGVAAAYLRGTSDDNEQRLDRGLINISVVNGVGSNFMVDTVYYRQTKNGTSTYTGTMLTFGLHFQQQYYSLGATIRPLMKITRTWDRDVASIDTTRRPFPVRVDSLRSRIYHQSGTDDINFPVSYALGVVLRPTDRWILALDYELRYLADAEVTSSGGGISHPWANTKGAFRLGAEYRANAGLALRGGYREDVQAFSPDGSAVINEPARGSVYSLGAGLGFGPVTIDLAYEYAVLKYEDIYQSNVNYNTQERHQFMMELSYRF